MGNELYEYVYAGYDHDDHLNRRDWADISQAALRRERLAEAEFATLKKDWESRPDLLPRSKHVIPLLDPSHHLVEKVWVRFRKHVKNSSYTTNKDGAAAAAADACITIGHWDVRRRLANPEERTAFRVTRKFKAYFVEAIYTVGGSNKNNNNQAEGSHVARAAEAVGAPAPAPKPKCSRKCPPVPALPGKGLTPASEQISLSKKHRRLQDLSNATYTLDKKQKPTVQKKPAPAPPQPHQATGKAPLGGAQYKFVYGDIVRLLRSSSSTRNNDANATAAACQNPTPFLAMVLFMVDPYTVRLSYPNRVQVNVPIHHIQLVQPMSTMMPMGGGYTSNNHNVARSTTGK